MARFANWLAMTGAGKESEISSLTPIDAIKVLLISSTTPIDIRTGIWYTIGVFQGKEA